MIEKAAISPPPIATTAIEWFSMKNTPPTEDDLLIMVYWEEEISKFIVLSADYTYFVEDRMLVDEDFNPVKITENMLWAYWPFLQQQST